MTDIDLTDMRALLDAEKTQLEEELSEHGQPTKDAHGWHGASSGFKTGTADENEVADQIEELTSNVPLVEELEARRREVLAALKRIEDGTFGKCAVCGKDIPKKRLEVNAAATTCVDCVV
jgi:RNA polymerase-binding transcription factor DksA